MNRRNRTIALLLAAALLFAMFFSALYIALEANHPCRGVGCHGCYKIGVCGSVFSSLLCVCTVVFMLFVIARVFQRASRRIAYAVAHNTPILLKTELLN